MAGIQLKINLSYGDEYMTANISKDTALWQFICWGVILPVIALLGLIGNALTMVVLWRKEMKSNTILYMRGLAVSDTGILITATFALTPFACANYLQNNALRYFNDNIYPIVYTPVNYVVMTMQACNVWITVSVSVERYVAICHPFNASRLCTSRKTLIVLCSITLMSVIYNLPRLLATNIQECAKVNETSVTDCYYLSDTMFGRTYLYKTVYHSVMYTMIIFVIPLVSLFILNVFLLQELMRMRNRRVGTNIHSDNEARHSLVLVLIVVVFILCQSPGLVSQFDIFQLSVFLKWISISNMLFVVNSAVNFLIYTAFGSKFRKILLRLFRKLFRRSKPLSISKYLSTPNGYELAPLKDNLTYSTFIMEKPPKQSTKSFISSDNLVTNNSKYKQHHTFCIRQTPLEDVELLAKFPTTVHFSNDQDMDRLYEDNRIMLTTSTTQSPSPYAQSSLKTSKGSDFVWPEVND